MLDFELEELRQNPDWLAVLSAYLEAHQSAHAAAKTSDQDFDGWLPRIMAIDGLDDETLPGIHGKLIAWGFLKFQLAGRGSGVVYQISPAGRQALSDLPDEIEALSDEEEALEVEGSLCDEEETLPAAEEDLTSLVATLSAPAEEMSPIAEEETLAAVEETPSAEAETLPIQEQSQVKETAIIVIRQPGEDANQAA